jgi:hypothetical protein
MRRSRKLEATKLPALPRSSPGHRSTRGMQPTRSGVPSHSGSCSEVLPLPRGSIDPRRPWPGSHRAHDIRCEGSNSTPRRPWRAARPPHRRARNRRYHVLRTSDPCPRRDVPRARLRRTVKTTDECGTAPRSGTPPLLVRLFCGCLARRFRSVSFQALFGDVQSLIIQLGLLGHVPYLRDYHGPENQ